MSDSKMKIVSPGDKLGGLQLRPDKVQAFGMLDPIAGESIGMLLIPYADDAQFSEAVTLVIPIEKIETYIGLIREAEKRLPKPVGVI